MFESFTPLSNNFNIECLTRHKEVLIDKVDVVRMEPGNGPLSHGELPGPRPHD